MTNDAIKCPHCGKAQLNLGQSICWYCKKSFIDLFTNDIFGDIFSPFNKGKKNEPH